jgi:GntR family transcriptional regulator of arabinose operon
MQNSSFKYVNLAQKLKRHIAVSGLRPGDRLPTEDELVQEHGLSRITIRRALALLENDGLVSRKRKLGTFVNRPLDRAAELHLVRGTVIILICNDPATAAEEDHALATVLRGLEHFLADHGFTVQIISLGRNEPRDRARLARAAEHPGVEGIAAIGPCADRYRDLLRSVPLVNSCTFEPNRLPWVGMSMEEATAVSVGHLLDRGHTRVGVICGPWVGSAGLAAFAAGARKAHERRGMEFRRSLMYQAFDGESLVDLAREVLSMPSRPTALFSGEDWRVCRAVIRAAEQLDLKIPGDLSLVGLGQNIQYLASPIGITAYVPDNERVGEEIGRALTNVVDGRGAPPEPVYVPGRLVERESVDAPPPADDAAVAMRDGAAH